ncbi:MAG: isoprenylcysteine carboxylmethyltransferase family protein [Kangiellaceae bacterium]|nr:isoprenylcysteine carboxylmethyltransferase family protein [Kangiellaceae bacterium]
MLKNKIPPPIIALSFALLIWAMNLYFPIYVVPLGNIVNVGYVLILFGLFLDILSFINFVKNKTTVNPIKPQNASTLVINGFYRFSRNPMYLGMFNILLGVVLLLGDISGLLMLPLLVWTMNTLQIIPEEKILEDIFGDEYIKYKENVRRWI